jgi:hypothetical protein
MNECLARDPNRPIHQSPMLTAGVEMGTGDLLRQQDDDGESGGRGEGVLEQL